MAELWLVCEGEPGSVDVALLQRVFDEVLAAEIIVAPACGSSPSTVARFLENQRNGKAAYVHDRDYRTRAEAEASLGDGRPGFFWRRHSIENYLLPPPIVLEAFQGLRERLGRQRRGGVPAWFAALPADPEGVADVLRECAGARAAEEACRLATQRLWAGLPPDVGHIQKRNPTAPSTDDPSDWREALCQEAERVCRSTDDRRATRSLARARPLPFGRGRIGRMIDPEGLNNPLEGANRDWKRWDGLTDEQGPIPAFGPARTDEHGRVIMTDEEWDARRDAAFRALRAVGDITDETDTDAIWDEVFRGLEGAR